ncbi:MAG TPA: hypothetical protein VFE62_15350 [Gemmataceae bacterium]|nr:hypothetical protein [Gemmataceae bacterium]
MNTLKAIGLGVLLLIPLGCGPATYEIKGQVKLDGTPIPDGYISFSPDGDRGASGGATITNGSYHARVTAGKAKVQITASKMTPLPEGETNMYGKNEEMRSYVPAKYNSNTVLTANITGSATVDFVDLKSE